MYLKTTLNTGFAIVAAIHNYPIQKKLLHSATNAKVFRL